MTDLSSGIQTVLALTQARVDNDPQETAEWLAALDGVVQYVGIDRAHYTFDRMAAHALSNGVATACAKVRPYTYTIPVAQQLPYPGDLD